MSLDLLEALLPYLRSFPESSPRFAGSSTVADFARHILAKGGGDAGAASAELAGLQEYDARDPQSSHLPLVRATVLISHAYRYTKSYAKLALEGTDLQRLEEFVFLAYVQRAGPITRRDLFATQIYEKSSGIEIVKRLIRYGFLEDRPHPDDARSKLLFITPAGNRALAPIYDRMGRVSRLVSGDLTVAELDRLIGLLERVEAFHSPLFQQLADDFVGVERQVEELRSKQ